MSTNSSSLTQKPPYSLFVLELQLMIHCCALFTDLLTTIALSAFVHVQLRYLVNFRVDSRI